MRATWRTLFSRIGAITVRSTTEDPYAPARWWRQTEDALDVSREVLGLLNVWAGFPVKVDRTP